MCGPAAGGTNGGAGEGQRAPLKRHYLPDGPPNSSDHGRHGARPDARPQGPPLEELPVDGRDFLAEQHAVVGQAAGFGRNRHAGRAVTSTLKGGHDNDVVSEPVTNVF
jgi:hypothetical protein